MRIDFYSGGYADTQKGGLDGVKELAEKDIYKKDIAEEGIEFMTPVNRSRMGNNVIGRDLFVFDPDGRVRERPMGHAPIDRRVLNRNNTTHRSLHAIFDGDLCRSCTMLDHCPIRVPNRRDRGRGARDTAVDFRLDISQELRLRDEMYTAQKTREWKDRYSIRTGIEATNSELKRVHGMRRIRLRQLVKVCFSVACKVMACNIKRWARAHITLKWLLEHGIITLVLACVSEPGAMTISLARSPDRWLAVPDIDFFS